MIVPISRLVRSWGDIENTTMSGERISNTQGRNSGSSAQKLSGATSQSLAKSGPSVFDQLCGCTPRRERLFLRQGKRYHTRLFGRVFQGRTWSHWVVLRAVFFWHFFPCKVIFEPPPPRSPGALRGGPSPASSGLTGYSQVDIPRWRYKHVKCGVKQSNGERIQQERV